MMATPVAQYKVGTLLPNGATVTHDEFTVLATGGFVEVVTETYPNGSYGTTIINTTGATTPETWQAEMEAKLVTLLTETATWTFPLSTAEQRKLVHGVKRLIKLVLSLPITSATATGT